MARELKTNTAVIVVVGPFLDKTDGITLETALTITNEKITLTAETDDGSAPTLILDNVTGATSGTDNDLNYITNNDAALMQIELSAANLNRLGRMRLTITDAANHLPVWEDFEVVSAQYYDAKYGAGNFSADAKAISGDTTAADNLEDLFEETTAVGNLIDFVDGTGYAGGTIKLASDATLNATQGSYAPAKAGDLMGLADDAITASKYDESTAFPLKSADASTTILARAGDQMALKDDAITSAKYDESTAFPLKSADAAATAIARTGADSDTLETLSDQIDGASTFNPASDAVTLAALQGLYAPAKAGDAMTLTEAYDAAKTAAQAGDSMAVSDKTGFSLSADGILAIWHQATSGIVTASTIGKLVKDNLDAAISTRSSHSAADVWSSVTRSLTDKTGFSLSVTPPTAQNIWEYATRALTDKSGFSLSQAFPTNFSSMAISALGKLTVGTNDDKTGYTASVSDKTGFSLSTAGILAIWHQLVSEIATASTIGKLIKDNLDAKVSEVGGGSLTAADIADAVLDEPAAGHTGVIATNLDAAVSTRSTYAGGAVASVTAGVTVTTNNDKTGYSLSVTPPTASQIDTQLSGTHGAGAWGAGATGSSTYTDTITDDDGDPLEDVQVEVYSSSDYSGTPVAVEETNVNGAFTFSLNPGVYYCRAIKSGYGFDDWAKTVT